jgi:hypothetical protein
VKEGKRFFFEKKKAKKLFYAGLRASATPAPRNQHKICFNGLMLVPRR